VFVFGFGKSQLAHGIPGKWLIESPDYGKVGEFFRGSLGTIVEISCSAPAINAAVFPGAPGGLFWSSSPNFSDSGKAWPIQFTHGISYPAEKSSMASVRLVRSVGGN
jgi:hypothetical protein